MLWTIPLYLPTSHSTTVPHACVIPFPSLLLAADFASYATTTTSAHPCSCLSSCLSCSGCITHAPDQVCNPTPTRFLSVSPAILAVACLIHIPLSAASFSQHRACCYLSHLEKSCLDPLSPLSKSHQRIVYACASNFSPPVFSSTDSS